MTHPTFSSPSADRAEVLANHARDTEASERVRRLVRHDVRSVDLGGSYRDGTPARAWFVDFHYNDGTRITYGAASQRV
jgi:hypothetical protein